MSREELCPFCEGKTIKATGVGAGCKTMKTNLNLIFGKTEEADDEEDGVFLRYGNMLGFDSSSGEYAAMFVEINYCPFCGAKMDKEQEHE